MTAAYGQAQGDALCLVTGNPNKLREYKILLGRPLDSVDLDLPELQALMPEDVVQEKSREAYRQLGRPILVEDTALHFQAWGGLPGALVKWFIQTVGTEGLCRMLGVYPDRTAVAVTVIGLCDGTEVRCFRGEIKGEIVESPSGNAGFGWDAIFRPSGSSKTFAQMSMEEKAEFSMRRLAIEKLLMYLD